MCVDLCLNHLQSGVVNLFLFSLPPLVVIIRLPFLLAELVALNKLALRAFVFRVEVTPDPGEDDLKLVWIQDVLPDVVQGLNA